MRLNGIMKIESRIFAVALVLMIAAGCDSVKDISDRMSGGVDKSKTKKKAQHRHAGEGLEPQEKQDESDESPDVKSGEEVASADRADSDQAPGGNPGNMKGKAIDFGPYMKDLQTRIKRNWMPPKKDRSKRVLVVFKVHKNGEVSNLRLSSSSGTQDADKAALKAVEDAAPMKPLPEGAPENVDIEFTFDYNIWVGKTKKL